MKAKHAAVAALAAATLSFPVQSSGAETQATFAHVVNSFSLVVNAPYRDAAPLFGPNGERGWGEGEWDPSFIYPQPGKDVAGAVFAIQHGSKKSIWVNTAFDMEGRHFQYVYFLPGLLVTTIDVNFEPVDAGHTKVKVVYSRTALASEANDHVKHLGEQDSKSGEHWEQAIDTYLKKRGK